MINFRRAICRSCHKGSFWYGLFDCQRYQPAPPVPPIPPKPPEPTIPQGVHGPPWIGASFYQGIIATLRQWLDFCRKIAENFGNCSEIFLCFNWADWRQQPYKLLREDFSDPPHVIPLWDLDQWNDAFWLKLREMFAAMKYYNIRPFIRILDFCSIKGKMADGMDAKRRFCFRSNKQRLIDHNLPGGLWGAPIRAHYAKLIEKLIVTLEAAGWSRTDPFYSLWNEGDVLDPETFPEGADRALFNQYKWWVDFMLGMGIPVRHLIVNVSRPKTDLWMRAEFPSIVIERHKCASPQKMIEIYGGGGGSPMFPNGDGPDPYALGRAGDKPDKREPSVEQAREMRKLILADGGHLGYCYFLRSTEQVSPPDITRAEFDVLRALAGKE